MNTAEMLALLEKDALPIPGMKVRSWKPEVVLQKNPRRVLDGVLELEWRKKRATFGVELKGRCSPKVFQGALFVLEGIRNRGKQPLLLVPFLREDQLLALEEEGLSGLDLSGNAVIQAEEGWSMFRSGKPNKYPESLPVKKLYRGQAGLVARMFSLQWRFPSVKAVYEKVLERGGDLAYSTVSRALAGLVDDNMVTERRVGMGRPEGYLAQFYDRLLEKLSQNFVPVKATPKNRLRAKIVGDRSDFLSALEKLNETERRVVRTGWSSTEKYYGTAMSPMVTFYCKDLDEITRSVGARLEGVPRFYDVEFIETKDDSVFFDQELGTLWASPLQCYLECMAGDQRDQDAAQVLKTLLVNEGSEGRQNDG